MINGDNVLLLKGSEIHSLFKGRELEIIESIKMAYTAHASGSTFVPHSSFVHFPDSDSNRIIALPAYLGGDVDAVGIKWIASFPENASLGLERASATIILNSTRTGLPVAIMEGASISAKRTAASAALAVQLLKDDREISSAGLVGCGLINFEITRFLIRTQPKLRELNIYDLDSDRIEKFRQKCRVEYSWLEIRPAKNYDELYRKTQLISFATTAIKPYVDNLPNYDSGAIVLNISLRDLSPQVVLSSNNIVDDIDHVCRAQTSVHLAELQVGNRNFINCSIGELLSKKANMSKDTNKNVIFSPFGLGVLDIALANLVYGFALEQEAGTHLSDFVCNSWFESD